MRKRPSQPKMIIRAMERSERPVVCGGLLVRGFRWGREGVKTGEEETYVG